MEPTDNQLNTLYGWIRWQMPTAEAQHAIKWLGNNATRREVSNEIKRIGELYHNHRLNRELCFKGSVWAKYGEEYGQ